MTKLKITANAVVVKDNASEMVIGSEGGLTFICAGQAGHALCGFFQLNNASITAFSMDPNAGNGGELVVVTNP
ncbi:MAG: hypothetical protein NZ585_12775 [Chloracidobacterium sp.]|nr:hypothetical protein [Chloracidobacterium sp.]MDW8217839.1 hypothetical protein [Acidobacteriota bacterium]